MLSSCNVARNRKAKKIICANNYLLYLHKFNDQKELLYLSIWPINLRILFNNQNELHLPGKSVYRNEEMVKHGQSTINCRLGYYNLPKNILHCTNSQCWLTTVKAVLFLSLCRKISWHLHYTVSV